MARGEDTSQHPGRKVERPESKPPTCSKKSDCGCGCNEPMPEPDSYWRY